MYMNNGLGMRIILTQINLIYAQWLGYYRSLARLHVTGSVTTFVTAYRGVSSQNTVNMNVNKG